MRFISVAAAAASLLAALPAFAAGDEPIPEDAWRALVIGKTVHYMSEGRSYGREYFSTEGDRTVFRGENGFCEEGIWAHADGLYCYAYGGDAHCFTQVMRGEQVVVITADPKGEPGDEQIVEKITEGAPLTCEREVQS